MRVKVYIEYKGFGTNYKGGPGTICSWSRECFIKKIPPATLKKFNYDKLTRAYWLKSTEFIEHFRTPEAQRALKLSDISQMKKEIPFVFLVPDTSAIFNLDMLVFDFSKLNALFHTFKSASDMVTSSEYVQDIRRLIDSVS